MLRSRTRFAVPATGIGLGALAAASALLGGLGAFRAVVGFLIIAGYGLAISALAGRSETASLLAGHPVDERWAIINLRALAFAGLAATLVAITGFFVGQASGRESTPYAIVGVTIALAYLGGILWSRARG